MKNRKCLIAVILAFVLLLTPACVQAFSIGELLGWSAGQDTSDDEEDSWDSGKESAGKGGEDARTDDGEDDDDPDPDGDDYYAQMELDEDGTYDTKDEVCAYLVQYHELPSNYMTKKEARELGWEGGALNRVVPGRCIGGDRFGNYEEVLPTERGREYHECDIDTLDSSSRGPKRIVYSGDDDNGEWNIYYTDDHYETFTLLWGDDE